MISPPKIVPNSPTFTRLNSVKGHYINPQPHNIAPVFIFIQWTFIPPIGPCISTYHTLNRTQCVQPFTTQIRAQRAFLQSNTTHNFRYRTTSPRANHDLPFTPSDDTTRKLIPSSHSTITTTIIKENVKGCHHHNPQNTQSKERKKIVRACVYGFSTVCLLL